MSTSHTPPSVLLIEPHDDLRRVLAMYFGRRGFEVLEFAGPDEALHVLEDSLQLPCAILIDAVLPGMGARGFRERQMAIAAAATIPVVVVSGLPDVHRHAHALGAVTAFRKPADLDILAAVLKACCDAGRREAPN